MESAPSEATYGQRLRAARDAKGLTQEALANAIGTTRYQVIKWETDKERPAQYHDALADFFHDDSLRLLPDTHSIIVELREENSTLRGWLEDLQRQVDELRSRLPGSGPR